MRSMIFADHNVYFGNIEKLKSRYNRKRLLDIYIIMEIYTRGFVDISNTQVQIKLYKPVEL